MCYFYFWERFLNLYLSNRGLLKWKPNQCLWTELILPYFAGLAINTSPFSQTTLDHYYIHPYDTHHGEPLIGQWPGSTVWHPRWGGSGPPRTHRPDRSESSFNFKKCFWKVLSLKCAPGVVISAPKGNGHWPEGVNIWGVLRQNRTNVWPARRRV